MIHILTTEVNRGPRSETDRNKAKAEMPGFNRLLVVLYPKQETFMNKMVAVEEIEHEQMVTLNFVGRQKLLENILQVTVRDLNYSSFSGFQRAFWVFIYNRYFIKKEAFYKFYKGKRGNHQEENL